MKPHYIGGNWQTGSGELWTLRNPGNLEQILTEFSLAEKPEADAAISAADSAFSVWANTPLSSRIELLEKLTNLLEERKEIFKTIISSENGKPFREAEGEVNAGVSEARYQLQIATEQTDRQKMPQAPGEIDCEIYYQPLGICLNIIPWNFPLAIILRKMIPALVWGNPVILKPSELTPLTAIELFKIIDELNFPAGVANCVTGKGADIGPALVEHPLVRSISFTGSTAVGLGIAKQASANNTRVQLELGGKNALVVLKDANLEKAVEAAMIGCFTCSGQWCTGTSRIILEKEIEEQFIEKFLAKVSQIKVGPGHQDQTTMGPLISEQQLSNALEAIEKAKNEGGDILTGGSKIEEADGSKGHFLQPTVIKDIKPTDALFVNEVFAPVVAITTVDSEDEALKISNQSEYGLSFSVFTEDKLVQEKFMQEIHAGLCHVNLPTGYRHASMPIAGWKNSGRGIPESGRFGREFYTEIKAVYRSN